MLLKGDLPMDRLTFAQLHRRFYIKEGLSPMCGVGEWARGAMRRVADRRENIIEPSQESMDGTAPTLDETVRNRVENRLGNLHGLDVEVQDASAISEYGAGVRCSEVFSVEDHGFQGTEVKVVQHYFSLLRNSGGS